MEMTMKLKGARVSPCKDCGDRQLGCHSVCDKYMAYREYMDSVCRKRIEANGANAYQIKSIIARLDKVNKRNGR